MSVKQPQAGLGRPGLAPRAAAGPVLVPFFFVPMLETCLSMPASEQEMLIVLVEAVQSWMA